MYHALLLPPWPLKFAARPGRTAAPPVSQAAAAAYQAGARTTRTLFPVLATTRQD